MSESSPERTYFLSYSRADEDFALRFAKDLRSNGVAVWVDQLDIRPSEHWDRAIERMVRDCCGLLVILSPRSVASDNVADEISFALEHGKSVLPVMIERCRLPLRITRMQMIDATGDYGRALQQCIVTMAAGPCVSRDEDLTDGQSGIDDPQVLETAKQELTAILGPIASILVTREAARSHSVAELRTRLADHIPDKSDRERFAGNGTASAGPIENVPKTSKSTLAPREVDRLGALLAHYLGPIANVIARRESAQAVSAEDLEQRLSLRISDEQERTEFLKRVRNH